MKSIGLVILMLGCAGWSVRATYAGQSVASSQQASPRSAANAAGDHSREADHAAAGDAGTHIGKPSDDQQNHRKISSNKPPGGNPSLTKSNRRNELTNGRERSGSDDSKNSHRPGTDKSRGAAQNGLARTGTINHAASDRTPGSVRPVVPSLSNVRHRGPNPAIIGGAENSNSRITAALDGTHMNRKRIGN
jgi:hypothetical protein